VTGQWGGMDAIIELIPPRGRSVALAAEIKRSVNTRDLRAVVEQLEAASARAGGTSNAIPIVIARYLAPPTQQWLAERGISYADATGNLRIIAETPALFLRDVGANKDPWRGPGRPRGALKGEPAARVVRALVDFGEPMTIPELIKLSGASSGATYRVIDFLEEQALVKREERGPITGVEWKRLLEVWAKDYGFMTSNTVHSFLEPRGVSALAERLRDVESPYAVTGSLAAQKWAPYAPPRAAMIYADNPDELVRDLGLRQVDGGANILLAAATSDVVFERTQTYDGLRIVAPSQAVVDLMTGPGRNPSEGQALLEWMEENVEEWRV
jgi:hypothetical protein